MISHIIPIAANEILLGIRNRWVLLAALVLFAFALVLGFLGAVPTGSVKTSRLVVTVASLATLSVYLVPLIALLLAFDAIAGEIERGTLPLLLASPASRLSVMLGKFIGHLTIVALAIIVGYGLAGTAVTGLSGTDLEGIGHLIRLIVTSIALGAVFLAFGYVASTSVRSASTAAALSVGIWLFAVVLYDLGLLGALILNGNGFFARNIFPYLLAANPADAFRLYNMSALEANAVATGLAGAASSLPFAPIVALTGLGVWLVLMLGLSALIFRRLEP